MLNVDVAGQTAEPGNLAPQREHHADEEDQPANQDKSLAKV